VIEFAPISSAAEFGDFDEPRLAKTVYDLSARTLDSNVVKRRPLRRPV
jgi:hypothetical protein